jgi:serine/threonine protein kinase
MSTVRIEFWNFANSAKEDGQTLLGQPSSFISYRKLKAWWTLDRIRLLLQQSFNQPYSLSVQRIQESYIIPLSLISYLWERPSYFDRLITFIEFELDDSRFPLSQKPDKLQNDIWEDFNEAQWLFCPLKLDKSLLNKSIDARCIFPGVKALVPPSRGGDNSTVTVMAITATETAIPEIDESVKEVVIKSYSAASFQSYTSEWTAYNNIWSSKRPCDNILRIYGSYFYKPTPQSDPIYNLVLEHADRGSLLTYYAETDPPRSPAEIRGFWRSLIRFLPGLEKIHEEFSIGSSTIIVHQDLKPSNILICSADSKDGPYAFTPKLCDFGMSNTKTQHGPAQPQLGPYNDSQCTYCPPEVNLHQEIVYRSKLSMDRWAAGCIIADAVAWVSGGNTGRQRFAAQRREEIKRTAPSLANDGRADCFHDNTKLLRCVNDLVNGIDSQDDLSRSVLTLALDEILKKRDPETRAKAGRFLAMLEILVAADEPLMSSETQFRSTSVRRGRRTTTAPPRPHNPSSLPDEDSMISHPGTDSTSRLRRYQSLNGSRHGNSSSGRSRPEGQPIQEITASLESTRFPQRGDMLSYSTNTPTELRDLESTGTYPEEADFYPDHDYPLGHRGARPSRQPSFSQPSHRVVSSRRPHSSTVVRKYDDMRPTPNGQRHASSPAGQYAYPNGLGNTGSARLNLGTGRSSSPDQLRNSPGHPDPYPHITLDDVKRWKKEKKKGRGAVLEGKDGAFQHLRGRDHLFIIDNSSSMQPHRDDLLEFFENVAYLLKEADPNGVDVLLTSEARKKHSNRTKELVDYIEQTFANGQGLDCKMEHYIDKVVQDVITNLPAQSGSASRWGISKSKPRPPISIYILTNGDWATAYNDAHMVLKSPILRLVDAIKDHKLPRTQAVLQFVRFGNDQDASNKLDKLDDLLEREEDIVDHKASTDGIWHILIGSLDIGNDIKPAGHDAHSPDSTRTATTSPTSPTDYEGF